MEVECRSRRRGFSAWVSFGGRRVCFDEYQLTSDPSPLTLSFSFFSLFFSLFPFLSFSFYSFSLFLLSLFFFFLFITHSIFLLSHSCPRLSPFADRCKRWKTRTRNRIRKGERPLQEVKDKNENGIRERESSILTLITNADAKARPHI